MFRFGNPAPFFFPGRKKPELQALPYPWNTENVPTFVLTPPTAENEAEGAEMSYLKPVPPILFEDRPPQHGHILKQVTFEFYEEYMLQVPELHTEIENPYPRLQRPKLRRGGVTIKPKREPMYMLILKRIDFELGEELIKFPEAENVDGGSGRLLLVRKHDVPRGISSIRGDAPCLLQR